MQINLGADIPNDKWWVTQCYINPVGAIGWENIYPEGETIYTAEWVDATPGTWHTFRIEVKPESMRITYYFDGNNIGSHISTIADVLKGAQFDITPGVWSEGADAITGYFDDVLIEY